MYLERRIQWLKVELSREIIGRPPSLNPKKNQKYKEEGNGSEETPVVVGYCVISLGCFSFCPRNKTKKSRIHFCKSNRRFHTGNRRPGQLLFSISSSTQLKKKKKPSQTSFPSTLPPVPPLTKDIDDAKRPSFRKTNIVSSKHGLHCAFASDHSLKTCSPSCLRKRNSSYLPLCFRTWKHSPAFSYCLTHCFLKKEKKNRTLPFAISFQSVGDHDFRNLLSL